MGRGIGKDLKERLMSAHESSTCLVPESPAEARQLRRALKHKEIVSPATKVYALASIWEELNPIKKELYKTRALAKLHPDWVFAGPTAAVLQGLYVPYRLLGKTHIATTRASHSRSSSSVQRHIVRGCTPNVIDGIRVTPIARTAFDCMCGADFRAALCIADSALRGLGSEPAAFVEELRKIRSLHANRGFVLAVAALANGLSESGGESTTRAVMIEEGFMWPTLQKEVIDPVDKSKKFRVDFYWSLPGGDVAGELDGREKYRNPEMTNGKDAVDVLADERLRESRVSGTNVKVMRFSYNDVMNTTFFCHLLTSYGIPRGFDVPWVARKQ